MREVSEREIIATSRQNLGLAPSDVMIDDAFVASSLRRIAAVLCPCSPSTLLRALNESLRYLINAEELESLGQDIFQQLLSRGDLLELHQVTLNDPVAKGTWIFPATPSFVVRPGGNVVLLGVARDEAMPLPPSLLSRIEYEGAARFLSPEHSEDLSQILRDFGLTRLSDAAWLRAPKLQSPSDVRDHLSRSLTAQSPSGPIPDLTILDPLSNVDFYKRRWIKPQGHSGDYVARRPQAYGAPLWCFLRLLNGQPDRFLDLPVPGSRWRGSDVAWYLQMAIDQLRGFPQHYRQRSVSQGICIDFFSPLPSWAQRRFDLIGRIVMRQDCLFSYLVPEQELAHQEAFLQNRLWLTKRNDSN